MFTGLIGEVGEVLSSRLAAGKRTIRYSAPKLGPGLGLGDSVAVNGACQTVSALFPGGFAAEALGATLAKTGLGGLRAGDPVNLEPALKAGDRLAGHFVQGHVSGRGRVLRVEAKALDRYLVIELPERLAEACLPEGSIAVDGVSLTIAARSGRRVTLNIIPTTWEKTTLRLRKAGALVNIETDVLVRAATRSAAGGPKGALSEKELRSWGC